MSVGLGLGSPDILDTATIAEVVEELLEEAVVELPEEVLKEVLLDEVVVVGELDFVVGVQGQPKNCPVQFHWPSLSRPLQLGKSQKVI